MRICLMANVVGLLERDFAWTSVVAEEQETILRLVHDQNASRQILAHQRSIDVNMFFGRWIARRRYLGSEKG